MEDASSNEEESEPEEIRQITQINKRLPDNNDYYGVELQINGEKQKCIIDTGSPVTIMSYNQHIHDIKEIKPSRERHQDVNKNEIKFMGKTCMNVEYNQNTYVNQRKKRSHTITGSKLAKTITNNHKQSFIS